MWRPPNATRHPTIPAAWPSAAEAANSLLFSPINDGRLELNHRTWVPAMVPWRASESGEVTPAVIEWYARFAEGCPGAIVVEATGIRDIPSGPLLRIGHERYEAGLRKLTEAVKKASGGHTKIFIQLIDFLRVNRRPQASRFFERYLRIDTGHKRRAKEVVSSEPWAEMDEITFRTRLSTLPREALVEILTQQETRDLEYGYRESINDIHLDHIKALPKRLPELFAKASVRAVNAGFDGVELHYAHAYTMASFLSRTNVRADGYGGTTSARLRCPLEVFEACRAVLPDNMPLGCRMLVDEIITGGSRVADAEQYAEAFAQAGMDFISLSTGGKFDDAKQPKIGAAVYPYTGESGFECMPTVYADARGPYGRNLPKMEALRQHLRTQELTVPIVIAGGIQTFEQAEKALQSGQGDIIGAARQTLADPDWFKKCLEGRGNEIRRCAMTNYCEALDQRHKEVTCRLWDRVQLDEPNVRRSADGRRRLTAPREEH